MPHIKIQPYSKPYSDQIIQLTLKITTEFNFSMSPSARTQ